MCLVLVTHKCVLCWSHTKLSSVPHTYAIGWSSSSLGTWHFRLLPTPSAVLPNHGGIGPAATIAAFSHISLPRFHKLQLSFGQMMQTSGSIHEPTVAPDQAIFCARCHMAEHCSGRLGRAEPEHTNKAAYKCKSVTNYTCYNCS
jgi:hypothetical protein